MSDSSQDPAPIEGAEDWGWVAELDSGTLGRSAEVSLELLLRGSQWVNRRVETIELVDEVTVRQSVSIDFRLPTKLPGGFTLGGPDHHALPLLVLPRRTDLAYFDAHDESGRSVPILTRTENARLTGMMLLTAAERAVGPPPAGEDGNSLERSLRMLLAGMPGRGRDRAREVVEKVIAADPLLLPDRALAQRLLADRTFRDLLGLFQYASAIHLPIGVGPGERRIVKIAWEGRWGSEELPDRGKGVRARLRRGRHAFMGAAGWRPENRVLDLPQLGGVESHHIQISTPAGVELAEVSAPSAAPRVILPGGSGLPDPNSDPGAPRAEGPARRVHLYLPRSYEMRLGLLDVNLRTPRHGLLMAAVMTGILVTALLGIYAARAEEIIGHSDTGAAILLLVPAILAGFLIRPGEHAMARVLLRGPRAMTTALGILPLIAAAALVVGPGREERGTLASILGLVPAPATSALPILWWVLSGLAAALTVALFFCCLGRGAAAQED